MKSAAMRALAAACVAIGGLHVLWARTVPVGENNDDAINLLLARALRQGAYSLPDGLGLPATFPPPGYPILLAPLTNLFEGNWAGLRFAALAASALLVVATWRLARRILSEEGAAAAALLVALNNVFMLYSGAVMPDVLYAACSVALFSALASAGKSPRRLAALAAAAGLAALLRPHGVILIASVGLAFFARREFRRGLSFSLLALLPSGLWMARNYAAANTSSGYAAYWSSMWSEPGFLVHCARVAATDFGQGLLGLVGLPFELLLAAAAAAGALIAYGAVRAVKRDLGAAAPAVYLACMIILQMAWRIEVVRYLLPILPLCWILLLKGLEDLAGKRRRAALGFVALAAAAALRLDVSLLAGRKAEAAWSPDTMAWIRENTPASARLQSTHEGAVMLLAEREALPMFAGAPADWLAEARHYGVGYILLDASASPAAKAAARSPGAAEVYRNAAEGTSVLKL